MKRFFYIFTIFSILLNSCVREDMSVPQGDDVPEGFTKVCFTVNISDPAVINTRAVDPDGLDVNNLTLFCFNEFGLFISIADATLKSHTNTEGISDSGTYEAKIPSHTHIIHFLGNHSAGLYDPSDFPGQTESMVIANMEGGSGMLVYWSRFEMNSESDQPIETQLQNLQYTINGTTYNGVKLIRNQAKITIDDWTTDNFTVTGFRTVNIPAFGTVAPHHPQRHFDIVNDWESTAEFVTLPHDQALMSDIIDINTKPEDYIFETENSGDNLVSVIIKGRNKGDTEDKYYRIVMQNADGSNFMIRRNHNYNIKITGELHFGQDTFEAALTAAASNNAWISIDEWVNEISNGVETLWVEETNFVLSSDMYAGTDWSFDYRYTKNSSGGSTAPTVTWIDNDVAYSNIENDYNPSDGNGKVTLHLFPMYERNDQQVGSLLIKHGKLQRKINIYVIRTQKFTPSWISSQVYGKPGENVTLMFTIPETCPEALFPFTVLVSVNHLDVRSESGQVLPVYVKGEEGYFGQEWEGINYKYAYTVTGAGKHRLHLHTLLQHGDADTEEVHLEAEFFETITKTVIFSGHDHSHRRIFVDNLHTYESSYAADEPLYYMLVPQKKASPLVFTIQLQERQSDGSYSSYNHAVTDNNGDVTDENQWHKNGKDEFLIYTQSFSFYDEYFKDNPGEYQGIQKDAWEGEVTMVNRDSWSTNGRVMAFRTLDYEPYENETYKYGLQKDGSYHIYMLTNSSDNKDVVRVSSNNALSPYVFEKDRNGNVYTGLYGGNEYRSVIFDVAHYRPFRFAAQVKVYDESDSNTTTVPSSENLLSNKNHGSQEESVDNVNFVYKPGQKVDILFDITSFEGSDGRSVHPFGENFGEEFEVYIDAPMLEIDASRIPANWLKANNSSLSADKLRKHPSIPGRFIYTVSKTREAERALGTNAITAHNVDASTKGFDNFGRPIPQTGQTFTVNQAGERKLLPFKKSTITSKGDITITTDKEKVVFWDKTFKVNTEHIRGLISYKENGVVTGIPKDAFVAFVRKHTGARIGVVSIYENGKFELNLRDEYKFNWEDDSIDFYYTDSNGKVYSFNYTENEVPKLDLNTLYDLVKQNKTIILTPDN